MLLVVDGPKQEVLDLQASGTPHLIVKLDADVAAKLGPNFMDASVAFQAAEYGLEQGLRDAAKVKEFWNN